jgi:hypothetical protein
MEEVGGVKKRVKGKENRFGKRVDFFLDVERRGIDDEVAPVLLILAAPEGVNNKIKVIKRKAYGFHDLRYFSLKIYQAFVN